MKKTIIIALIALMTLTLVSCGTSEAPLTEAQQAEKYGLSLDEFKKQKEAAARMNMTIEQHLNMSDSEMEMDHSNMEMTDDSYMIEDDAEMIEEDETMEKSSMTDDEKHMQEMHTGEDYVPDHGADEHGSH